MCTGWNLLLCYEDGINSNTVTVLKKGKAWEDMNIKEVLTELDKLYEQNRINEVEPFMQDKLVTAKKENDTAGMITIVNEMIGFYRDMGAYEKALHYCEQVIALMKECGFEGTVPFATTLLNVANAYRAAGKWDDAEQAYKQVEAIYAGNVPANDYRYASLYNNWSLLYQEEGKFEKAKISLEQALTIISKFNNTQIEIASTHTNLATTLLRLGETKEAMDHLILALSIFEEDGGRDFHYSAALSAMGDAKYLSKDLSAAADYYEKAMTELEKHVGRTEAYQRIADNLQIVREKLAAEKHLKEEPVPMKKVIQEPVSTIETQDRLDAISKEGFAMAQPSEDDFEDDYDIDNEDDFERNDFEVEEDFKQKNPSEDDFEETIDPEDYVESETEANREKQEEERQKEEREKEEVLEKAAKELDMKPYPIVKGPSGLEICEAYYREFGAAMIHEKFPEYEDKIAVGLVGEGSDCFGFDDYLSRDHDFGPAFAMWVTEETYRAIGKELEKAYKELPQEFMGLKRLSVEDAKDRVGVCIISDFYNRVLGLPAEPQTEYEWYNADIGSLRAATNGKVFRDDEGIFSGIRKKILELYPEKVRIFKIAEECAYLSQYGQYNYPRMMIRRDYVTAKILIANFMQHTMQIIYLLNRQYEPYYKWQRAGMDQLAILPEVGCILEALADMPDQRAAWAKDPATYDYHKLNGDDNVQLTIEIICQLILDELKAQGLATGDNPYLDSHRAEILKLADDPLVIAKTRKISRERVRKCMEEKHMGDLGGIDYEDEEELDEELPIVVENGWQEYIPGTPHISEDFLNAFTDVDFSLDMTADADNLSNLQLPQEMLSGMGNHTKTYFYQEMQGKENTVMEPVIRNSFGGPRMEETDRLFQKLQEQEMQEPYSENSPSAQEIMEKDKEVLSEEEQMRIEEAKRIAEQIEQNKINQEKEWIESATQSKIEFCRPEENEDLVDKVVAMEWKQFDKVQNEGGRADCQDDWNTFSIMRKSQYYTWNRELLESFYHDLQEAEDAGWNLITEKYARMMESTAPLRFAAIKDTLPKISLDKKNVGEQIIKIQVGWMEEFAASYPNMAGNARCIHTSEDTPYETSYETYLRGELNTYSDDTLALYGRMIVNLAKEGKNLARMIMTNTALLYGYSSLDAAEKALSGAN